MNQQANNYSNMQFSVSQKPKEKCPIIIGFDFGTSCTKIILRSPYHYGGKAFAIPFGQHAHPISSYLLSSVLCLGEDGFFKLGNNINGALYRDIKLYLTEDKEVPPVNGVGKPINSKILAVGFLALSLRKSRKWFLETQSKLYSKYELEWEFNLGLPSADYANTELSKVYKQIATASWNLSVKPVQITVETIEAEMKDGFEQSAVSAYIEVIPEVVAEVIGYARSHQRDDGLHILVDIGASTLDICGFILHPSVDEGDDCYELLTSDVRQLGTLALYRNRVDGIHKAIQAYVDKLWNNCDPVKPIPETPHEYIPQIDRLTEFVDYASNEYEKKCRQMLWKTLIDLKKQRDPNSHKWTVGLPIFLCGGGSKMKLYSKMLTNVSDNLVELYPGTARIQSLTVPKPDQLDSQINENNYHRFTVAWGLSHPELDIGQINRPEDIDDVAPPPVNERLDIPWER